MNKEQVGIYVDPQADIGAYPDSLLGDMSALKDYRSEAQWIFYLMLKDKLPDVCLCRDYPKKGIFLIHKGNVPKYIWNPDLFVVSMQWDYPRDDRAQLHLVSNIYKTTKASLSWLDRLSFSGLQYYVPPIMHPVITPRNPARGELFENIVYFGELKNLDEAFRTESFRQQVEELGLKFIVISDPDKMTDYTEVDAIFAVRKTGMVISNKSSVKMINAWRGGVPAILGCEVGLRETRTNEYDYIEVDSVEDVINALKLLKNDVNYRRKVIANAGQKAVPFSAEGQQEVWVDFFENTVIPAYREWQRRPSLSKYTFLFIRWIRCRLREVLSYLWHHVFRRHSRDYS